MGVDEEPDASRGDVWVAYLHAKRAAEEALRATSLDWTILRPGRLTDDPGVGKVLLAPSVPRGCRHPGRHRGRARRTARRPGHDRADARAGRGRRRRARRRRGDRPAAPVDDDADDTPANASHPRTPRRPVRGRTGRATERTREVDVVVIGAGAVGENAADYAHRAGLSTVLVESELVGGECSYWACMPSKALLRTADAVVAARRLPGVTAEFDVEAVLKRRDAIAHGWDDASQVDWAEGAGISVVRGRARLDGERLVRVGDEVVRARHASSSPPAAARSARRSPAWTPSAPGPAATPPPRMRCRAGSACSAAGWSAASWRRRGGGSGRRWCCWSAGRGCWRRRSPSRRRRWSRGCGATGWTCGWTPGSMRSAPRPADAIALQRRGRDDRRRRAAGRHRAPAERRRPRARDRRPDARRAADRRRHRAGATASTGSWLYAAGDVTGRAPLTHQGKYDARIVGAAIGARAAGRAGGHGPGASTSRRPTTRRCRRSSSPTRRSPRSGGPPRRRARRDSRPGGGPADRRRRLDHPGGGLRRRGADGRRRGPRRSRRPDLRRSGHRRAAARGDDRSGRGGAAGTGCGTRCPPTRR